MTRELQPQERFHCILRSANLALETLYGRMLKPFGISYVEYIVLSALWECDGMQCGTLALTLGVNASSVSRTVKRLERAGLVARRRGDSDERTVRIWLTPAGRDAEARTCPLRARLAMLSGMTTQEMESLDRMARHLEHERACAH